MIRAGLRASLATVLVLFVAGLRSQAVVVAAIVGVVAVLQSAVANGLMGHTPLPPPARSADEFLARSEKRLERELRGRGSRFGWRRRRAYRACLTLIRAREAVCGLNDDPWKLVASAKPTDAARSVIPRSYLSGSEARRLREAGLLPAEFDYLAPGPVRPAEPTYLER